MGRSCFVVVVAVVAVVVDEELHCCFLVSSRVCKERIGVAPVVIAVVPVVAAASCSQTAELKRLVCGAPKPRLSPYPWGRTSPRLPLNLVIKTTFSILRFLVLVLCFVVVFFTICFVRPYFA